MELETLGVILAALSGLYYAMYKNHGCIRRIETKLESHLDMIDVREEITDLKDAIRQLK